MSNPLLEPIHGVSLFDYAAISSKMASGISQDELLKTLGIETAVFEEAAALWIARMQEDSSFEVSIKFGAHFAEVDSHPVLGNIKPVLSQDGADNLEKLKTDHYFYQELCGARQAAYEYGMDGAQWILENYGITLGDFQGVAMQWMEVRNQSSNDEILHFVKYMTEKQEEYAAKFAAEQGGNVADEVEF